MLNSPAVSLTALLAPLIGGALAGALVLLIGGMETKWIVYFAAGIGFLTLLFLVENRVAMLWGVCLLGFQMDLYLRVLYGHADSAGLALHFCVLPGVLFLAGYLPGRTAGRPLRWLGPGAIGWMWLAMAFAFLFSTVLSDEKFIGATSMFTYLQYYLIFFLALNVMSDPQRLPAVVKLLLVTVLLQSVVYFVQSVLGFTFTLTGEVMVKHELTRPGGTVGTTPASFATFMFPLLMIGSAVTVSRHLGRRWRIGAGVVTVLGFMALILTYTRGAWAAALLGLVWLSLFALRYRLMRPWLLTALATGAGAAAAVAVPFVLGSRDDNPLESAFDERFALMEMAWQVIQANPLSGVGPGAYGFTFKRFISPDLADHWLFIVHNTYLLFMAEFGVVPGITALLLWLWAGIFLSLRLVRRCSARADVAGDETAALAQAVALGTSSGFVAIAFEMYWEPLSGLSGMTLLIPYWFLLGLVGAWLWRLAPAPDRRASA